MAFSRRSDILFRMPQELRNLVTQNLDAGDLLSMKLTCKEVYRSTDAPNLLNRLEFEIFNRLFEQRAPERPISLACVHCHQHLPPGSYSDRQARKCLNTPRCCIRCNIRRGTYNCKTFRYKILSFVCVTCKQVKSLATEAEATSLWSLSPNTAPTIINHYWHWCGLCFAREYVIGYVE